MSSRARHGAILVLVFLVLSAAERAILHRVQLAGVGPDPLLIASVLMGFRRGVPAGVALGFGTGLARDVLAGRYIGLTALTRGLVAGGAGLLRRRMYGENILIPTGITFAASVAADTVLLLVLGTVSLRAFHGVILPAAAFNAVLTLGFYACYRMFGRRWRVSIAGERPHWEAR